MKTLDRYILREFLRTFVGILAVFSMLLLLKEVVRELPDIYADNPDAAPMDVISFFVLTMPGEILFAIPTAVLLAMMFSLGAMAKHKELLAIHASGISYLRIAFPLFVAIASITLLTFAGYESLVPACKERLRYIQKVKFDERPESVLTRNKNVTTKGRSNRFYMMKNFFRGTNHMESPTIIEMNEDGWSMAWRIDAESAQFVVRDKDGGWLPSREARRGEPHYWRFHNAVRRVFQPDGQILIERHETVVLPMEEDLDRFLDTEKRVSQMNIFDLWKQCSTEAERDRGERYLKLAMRLHGRMALPLSTLLLGMLGYTFSVRSSIRSRVFEFSLALLALVLYYSCVAVFDEIGRAGLTLPLVAAWAPNFLFTIALVWRFRVLETVPRG